MTVARIIEETLSDGSKVYAVVVEGRDDQNRGVDVKIACLSDVWARTVAHALDGGVAYIETTRI
jgi:predicted nucleotidyltransferase